MFPILQIGPLALQTPGLLILIGIWLGLSVSERFASRLNAVSNQLYNLVLVCLITGIIGARLAYVILYSAIFIASPLNIFSLTPTMFNGQAGLLIGLMAGLIYAQRKSLPLWPTLDAITPGLSVFMIFNHLANFASGDAFGSPVNMPLAINLWGQSRHPVQLYEMAAAILIALALIFRIQRINQAHEKPSTTNRSGIYFWAFLALTSLARLFLEFFRGDSTTILGSVHVAQVIAWIFLAVSLWRLNKYQQENQEMSVSQAKDTDHAS